MVTVTACLYMNPVSDSIAKMVLFKKMDTHTFLVITEDFAPYAADMVCLMFEDYSKLLGTVFQPVTESKTLKLTFFESRTSTDCGSEPTVRRDETGTTSSSTSPTALRQEGKEVHEEIPQDR